MPEIYFKDFDAWNVVKKHLNAEERKINIRAGEIRWVSFGVNVGSEIDGKGVSFNRPALVINVSGSHIALVVPMSTKVKLVVGYIPMKWKGKVVALCIHQTKVVSQKRIFSRMGRISETKLKVLKNQIKAFFDL